MLNNTPFFFIYILFTILSVSHQFAPHLQY